MTPIVIHWCNIEDLFYVFFTFVFCGFLIESKTNGFEYCNSYDRNFFWMAGYCFGGTKVYEKFHIYIVTSKQSKVIRYVSLFGSQKYKFEKD